MDFKSGVARPTLKWLVRVGLIVLAAELLVSAFAPTILLLARGPKVRTPFCSGWKLVSDANLKARSERRAHQLFSQFQILSEEDSRILWRTPYGDWWVPSDSHDILAFLLEQQERGIYGSVHAGDVVLDAGAHVGVFTRKALDSGARRVIAVEPSPNATECFRRNFAAELASGRVTLIEKGIWGSTGDLPFFVNGNGDAANSFVNRFTTARVVNHMPVISIDELARQLSLDRLDMIKTDIKGATEQAISGAQRVIMEMRPRFSISTEEPPEDIYAIMRMLEAFHYRFEPGACEISEREIRSSVLFAFPLGS